MTTPLESPRSTDGACPPGSDALPGPEPTYRVDRVCRACGSELVRVTEFGALDCTACGKVLDLDDDFGAFARHGDLVALWGRTSCLVSDRWSEVDPDHGEVLLGRRDRELDQAIRENADRIAELADTLRGLRELYRASCAATKPAGKRQKVPPLFRQLEQVRQVMTAVIGVLTIALVDAIRHRGCDPEQIVEAIRVRGGDPALLDELHLEDGAVRPRVDRSTAFSSYRHALSAAFGIDYQVALGVRQGSFVGAKSAAPTPSGIVFNQMAVAPTHVGTTRASGEDRLLSGLAAREAIAAARVERMWKGGRLRDPGRPLDRLDMELLRLVDAGDGVKPWEAIFRMPHAVATPAGWSRRITEHEARLRLKHAREAITEELLARGLIPTPKRRRSTGPEEPESGPDPDATSHGDGGGVSDEGASQ